ncbi:anthrone oxygenase family protein [Mesorhizobium sp. M0239]|uniref:anthrone oxygenase family protein n=1 Tax=Mesorhizobium sp. M0239 TaxID=2956924 RepID=UPI00333E0DAE
MIAKLLPTLIFIAALGSGVVGGVFFAFSSFVMPGLARMPATSGIAAMNSINVTAVTPLFMTALFGTALVCVLVAIGAVIGWSQPGSLWLIAGSLLYLIGIVVVTMIFNVPLNDALAAVDLASSNGAGLWPRYLNEWVMWNHVRAISGIAALASFWFATR